VLFLPFLLVFSPVDIVTAVVVRDVIMRWQRKEGNGEEEDKGCWACENASIEGGVLTCVMRKGLLILFLRPIAVANRVCSRDVSSFDSMKLLSSLQFSTDDYLKRFWSSE
jgi:hypothetical protein